MKETFIVRTEWSDAIFDLCPEDKATIFDNLFHYHLGNENLINLNNLTVKLVWKLIQPNLIRNIDQYDKRRDTSIENGKKGGRPQKELNQDEINLINLNNNLNNLTEPNVTLSVLDSVIVSVLDSDNDLKKKSEESEISKNEISTLSQKIIDAEKIIEEKDKIIQDLKNQEEKKPRKKVPQKKESEPKIDLTQTCRDFWQENKEKYATSLYTEFLAYWTEKDEKGKERWQNEKYFEVGKRLAKWQSNAITFNQNKQHGTTSQISNQRNGGTFSREQTALDLIAITEARFASTNV